MTMCALRGLLPLTAVLASMALVAPSVLAATLRATLLVPADDPRLERSRLERAAPSHPQGPAEDALRLALKDAALPLEAAGVVLTLDVAEVADAARFADGGSAGSR